MSASAWEGFPPRRMEFRTLRQNPLMRLEAIALTSPDS